MDTTDAQRAPQERPHVGPIVAWSVLALLQVGAGFITLATRDDQEDTNPLFDGTFVLSSIVVYSILVLLTVGIAAGYSLDVQRALGLRRFEPRWLGAAAGVIVATFVVGAITSLFGDPAEEQGLAPDRWEPDKAGIFVAAALVVVLFVPFAEELFFRGLGVRVLMLYGGLVAILVTGVIFGLVHGILGALPPLVLFGIGLAWVRLRSASIWPVFIGHAAYNGLGVLVLVISWSVETP